MSDPTDVASISAPTALREEWARRITEAESSTATPATPTTHWC